MIFEFNRISVLFKWLNLKNRHIYSRLDIDHNEFGNPPGCLFLWTEKRRNLLRNCFVPIPTTTTTQQNKQPTKQTTNQANRQSAEETFESGIQERRRHSKWVFLTPGSARNEKGWHDVNDVCLKNTKIHMAWDRNKQFLGVLLFIDFALSIFWSNCFSMENFGSYWCTLPSW